MALNLGSYLLIFIVSGAILLGNVYATITTYTDDVVINPGNLGVGTSSPIAKLHVVAGSQDSGTNAVLFQKTRSATNAVPYTFDDVGGVSTDANGGAFWRGFQLGAPSIAVSGSTVFPRLVTYAEYNSITDPTSRLWVIDAANSDGTNQMHDIVYRISGKNILYLDDTGNIGVGTSSPIAKLHVVAGSQDSGTNAVLFQKTRSATNAVRYTFDDVGGVSTDANGGAFWRGFQLGAPSIAVSGSTVFPRLVTYAEYNSITDPTSRLWVIDAANSDGTNQMHDIVYRISGKNILYLDDTGNIGVGTSSPIQKLDVSGNIRLTGNIVSPNDICIGTC